LDRPEHDNLITGEMMKLLRDHLRAVKSAVDVLVIQSSGNNFTRGRDQHDRSGLSRKESLGLAVDVNRALVEIEGLVVAAVRGYALGFGSGLVVQSDLVVASESSVFGFDEMAHGFPPMIVMSYLGRYLLPRHVLELVVTHRELTAPEAAAIGMVNRVVGDDALDDSVAALVSQLSKLNVAAAKRAKRYLREIEGVALENRFEYALGAQLEWFESAQ
jgi:enoyl-CoA hydratase/carnithine racemase